MFAKKGGRGRKEQREYTERIILTTCEMQKPKTYSYLALHDGAIEKMLHHCTPATNTKLKAEQGFDELRLTTSKEHHQKVLYTPHCRTLVLPVTVNILQRRRLSGRLFETLYHSPAETLE